MAWQTIDQQYEKKDDKNERSNYLKDILVGLQIANNNDPWTLAGFGLGRWLANYLDRGWKRREEEIMKDDKGVGKGNNEPTIVTGSPVIEGNIARGLLGDANLGAGNAVTPEEVQALKGAVQRDNPYLQYMMNLRMR